MELHSIKEKESKSKPTGDSSLKLAKDVISPESIKKKRLVTSGREFCACYMFLKTLTWALNSFIVTLTKWITIASQWMWAGIWFSLR